MTQERALKRETRARMAETGENYTTARRKILADRAHDETKETEKDA